MLEHFLGLILLMMLLAGSGGLAIGLRGRKVGGHPLCRGCEFDVHGIYPARTQCPECGAELNERTIAHKGHEQKMGPVNFRQGQIIGGSFPPSMDPDELALEDEPVIDIILRPSKEAAARTVDLTQIWGEEIVIEGVEVRTGSW